MVFSEEENAIYQSLLVHAKENGLKLNPNNDLVENIIKGLYMISQKKGEKYCPCRVVTGKPEADKKIICPCEYHLDEIKQEGHCFCNLFVAAK